jgi:hypothetical protein
MLPRKIEPALYKADLDIKCAPGRRFRAIKTTNTHWHVSGLHFRYYHVLFEEQAIEILAMTDEIVERCAT